VAPRGGSLRAALWPGLQVQALQVQAIPVTMVLASGPPDVLVASAPPLRFATREVAPLGPGSSPSGATTRAEAPRPKAAPKPTETAPSGQGGDERRPGSPVGPRGPTFFGAGTTAPGGGAASALWCAILLGGMVCAVRAMRRYRPRFVMCEPAGFDFPQQRPG
jgi:hypothetical protein